MHSFSTSWINSGMIREAIKKTWGSAGPSGLDADGWLRMLVSGKIDTLGDLRKAIAGVTK